MSVLYWFDIFRAAGFKLDCALDFARAAHNNVPDYFNVYIRHGVFPVSYIKRANAGRIPVDDVFDYARRAYRRGF